MPLLRKKKKTIRICKSKILILQGGGVRSLIGIDYLESVKNICLVYFLIWILSVCVLFFLVLVLLEQ